MLWPRTCLAWPTCANPSISFANHAGWQPGPMTGRCKLRAPVEAQRNNQSALESSTTPPLPTYRPESQLTKRKNVLRSDAALRKNCVFQEKCASDWTHKFLKNASLLIKKGPKRTNSPKIRSLHVILPSYCRWVEQASTSCGCCSQSGGLQDRRVGAAAITVSSVMVFNLHLSLLLHLCPILHLSTIHFILPIFLSSILYFLLLYCTKLCLLQITTPQIWESSTLWRF